MASCFRAPCIALVSLALACGGGGGGRAPSVYSIAGTIEGLGASDTGLVLVLNESRELAIDAGATGFVFSYVLVDGANYAVAARRSPAGLTCEVVEKASGMVHGDVGDVKVSCHQTSFHVSGRVRGLARPGLVLALNGQDLPVSASGTFSFPAYVPQGSSYAVTVSAQPAPQTCKVTGSTGTMGTAVTDVVVTCTGCAGGFCWENPLPQGNTMRGMWAAASDDVWAVGLAGTILHYDGESWAQFVSPLTTDLYAVWGGGANEAWAVGAKGTLLRWDGWAWSVQDSGTAQDLMSIWGSSASDVWMVGAQGTALHWDGHGWTSPAATGTTQTLKGIWVAGPGDAWAVASDGAYRWNGTSWTKYDVTSDFALGHVQMSAVGLGSVWGRATDDVYVTGGACFAWRWNGSAFELMDGGACPGNYAGIWGSGTTDLWALFVYQAGGLEYHGPSGWTESSKGYYGGPYPASISGTSPSDVWVGRAGGSMLHWNGSAWQEKAGALLATPAPYYTYTPYAFTSLWGTGASDLWATGYVGVNGSGSPGNYTTARWKGSQWSASPDPVGKVVWGKGASDLWILGLDSSLNHLQGNGWTKPATNTTATLNDVWGSDWQKVWAVGAGGVTDFWNGGTWTPGTAGVAADLNAVWGTAANDVWAVGASGTIVHWTGSWATVNSNVQAALYDVWGSGPSDVWAVGGGGTVVHYLNGAWAPVNVGTTVNLFGVWGSSANDVWVVGGQGTVLRWNGKAWSVVPSGTTYALRAVWGSGAGDVRIAGNNGAILTWTP